MKTHGLLSGIALALLCGCQDIVIVADGGTADLAGEWDYVTSLPGDEGAPCVERGHIILSDSGSLGSSTITSYETNCGAPQAHALTAFTVAADRIAFTAGTCAFAGALLGAGPDSVAGSVVCTGRGTGPWHAARVRAGSALVGIEPGDRTLTVGGSQTYRATMRDPSGRVLYGRSVTWVSTVPGIVGLAVESPLSVIVTGLAPGTTQVVAEHLEALSLVTVTVATSSFTSIGLGSLHSCGLSAAGAGWCWGLNQDGMLGTGDTVDTTSPAPVAGGHVFTRIAGGRWHTCALDAAGAAWCWGYGGGGWLGDGTASDHLTPAPVAGGHVFTSLVVGQYHACALDAGGAAWCWGGNGNGELGDSTTFARQVPVAVKGGHAFVELAAGWSLTCGRTVAGAAWCWGTNDRGQQGTGSTDTTGTPYPSLVSGGLAFSALAAGRLHACGIAGGAAYCWGGGVYGQTGLGMRSTVRAPTAVAGGHVFTAIATSNDHTCALEAGGTLWCWGSNGVGELGVAAPTESDVPVAVSGGHAFARVRAGEAHTCALDTGSVLWCWGRNWNGQLGDGTRTDRRAPVRVLGQP